MSYKMHDIYMNRLLEITGVQTFGHLHIISSKDVVSLTTLELPWKNNQPFISCIPANTYPFSKCHSRNKDRVVVCIHNVPGRSAIQIHIANEVKQLEGCIAVALSTKDINHDGVIDVTMSTQAFERLMGVLPDKGFIHISDEQLVRV